MTEIRQTKTFAQWLDDLRDIRARARVQARIDDLRQGTPEISSLWEKGFANYGSTMGRVTGFIL